MRIDHSELAGDEFFLNRRGIPIEEAARQLRALRAKPIFLRLDRPCVPGDGVRVLGSDEISRMEEVVDHARGDLKITRFIPASGAASRMFRTILEWRECGRDFSASSLETATAAGVAGAYSLLEISRHWHTLPFWPPLVDHFSQRGLDADSLVSTRDYDPLFSALVDASGLDLAHHPKALLSFHSEGGRALTPLEEHLAEAAATRTAGGGTCHLHFTISPEHIDVFRGDLKLLIERLERDCNTRFIVTDSIQNPATDTLALEADGTPMRTPDGSLHLHPAGHGALIENLASLHSDFATIRNIDNVVPSWMRPLRVRWNRVLLGLALTIRETIFRIDAAMEEGRTDSIEEAARYLEDQFGWRAPSGKGRSAAIRERLNRPFRVAAVVRNTGEPGGGPFWVRDAGGSISRQIVELSQVDETSLSQKEIVARSTHFNPVDMVCLLADRKGRSFDLMHTVDPEAYILAKKSVDGRPVRVLERPGLWNGAMAGWNTFFVELPLETFNPVKTVNDLLRPSHQPAR